MNKGVIESMSRIRKGQVVEVTWIDACESQNVSCLENEDFAAYKTSIGRFLDRRKESTYNQDYVIICEEVTDGIFFEITSIPLSVVMDIKVIGENT